jgi:hypothetical protein
VFSKLIVEGDVFKITIQYETTTQETTQETLESNSVEVELIDNQLIKSVGLEIATNQDYSGCDFEWYSE